ncbi:hypothetical protein PISMIDRAFT_615444 [Pisolithus microcarpus 441]|uniref:Uncharacterized protein n=1 Tax=Pisolithus microcarpus 441 TaxID=765257 RepID=A0A0C9YTC6_9AGAM|nr:hypothetical protein BKA83DRAFT_615444 [Pisolithus microcarpus]KIK19946.1 hypothetical protein PISMIDRAFT_615444 [Pisolithus microcarpus 441]
MHQDMTLALICGIHLSWYFYLVRHWLLCRWAVSHFRLLFPRLQPHPRPSAMSGSLIARAMTAVSMPHGHKCWGSFPSISFNCSCAILYNHPISSRSTGCSKSPYPFG